MLQLWIILLNLSWLLNIIITVQNKLHFAITGYTAAEIIVTRASSSQPHMGLTSWHKGPTGKVLASDVSVAKNYLKKEEISQLNRIVNMYIDYAEFQAARAKIMTMQDWVSKLDAFLKFNEQEILADFGKISHEVAKSLALQEYEKYKIKQDLEYKYKFNKLVEQQVR